MLTKGRSNWIFTGIILLVVTGLFLWGSRESSVHVSAGEVSIQGFYGIEIPLEEIESVELRMERPTIKRRMNGMSIGQLNKGHYDLGELGKGRLYIHSSEGPYLYIKTQETSIFINFKDAAKTEAAYNQINSSLN